MRLPVTLSGMTLKVGPFQVSEPDLIDLTFLGREVPVHQGPSPVGTARICGNLVHIKTFTVNAVLRSDLLSHLTSDEITGTYAQVVPAGVAL